MAAAVFQAAAAILQGIEISANGDGLAAGNLRRKCLVVVAVLNLAVFT